MIDKEKIIELYRECATVIPSDIEDGIKKALDNESEESSKEVLRTIIENINLAKYDSKPICQDTGTPYFYVQSDGSWDQVEINRMIEDATEEATKSIPLRPNAVGIIGGKNIGNKAIIHYEKSDKNKVQLLMKGGGSENISKIYSLPDIDLKANRDMDGVKRCVLDAVFKAQGKGCPPYIIGVAIGGNIEQVAALSKKQLLKKIDDSNKDEELLKMEKYLMSEINRFGIGPLGLGGKTTAIGVKIAVDYRHPASYFVGVSFGCWALRRAFYE